MSLLNVVLVLISSKASLKRLAFYGQIGSLLTVKLILVINLDSSKNLGE